MSRVTTRDCNVFFGLFHQTCPLQRQARVKAIDKQVSRRTDPAETVSCNSRARNLQSRSRLFRRIKAFAGEV